MKLRNLGKAVMALMAAGILVAGFVTLLSQPAEAIVFEVECPSLPTCYSTEYLKVYGGCSEFPETCVLYRYEWSSTPNCMVCN